MPSHMEGSKVGKEDVMEFIKNASASAVMQGELQVRPSKGGDVWIDHSFVLTTTELLVLETTTSDQTEASEVVGMYDICPSCSVFETNLGQFTFELVTPRKILHVKSESREVTAAWIDCIRKVIADSEPNMADPVLQLAIAKIEEDVFYDVSFHDDKVPLGIVFERSGEWAMVKSAMKPELGVRVGSALSSVNGESCIFKSHEYTIGKLKNWKPPLHLGFRLPVTKNGYLAKRPQSGSKMGWKVYFFSLGGGRLIYKDDEANSKAKGGVPLKGSAVSLISSSEIGKSFCIRVVSGVTSLVMQGETQDEMMDWAATLYHAIAIANGGGHIISLERKRRDEEISFQQKKLAEADMKRRSVASAEEERLAKQKADEEEALAAQQAADEVAAAKRKAEEDAARLLAEENAAREEEERLKREQFERQERKIEEANCMLEGAIEIEDAPTLETAIGAVEGMDVAHLVEKLPLAKQKLQELGGGPDMMAKEAARVKAEEDAARIRAEQEEARVKAEEEAAAQEAARIRAEEEAARVRAEEEAALREEVRLREEEEARVRAEEEAVRQREEEEAAKERAEQDAHQENEPETGGKEIHLAIDAMERARLQKLASGNYSAKSSFASSDRNLVNVKDLVEEDKRRQRQAETRTLTTDEEFALFFKKYARVIDGFESIGPVLTPVQFSAMLRLVTGEKGNLFSEMKTFNKFDDDGNGYINVTEFVEGFKDMAKTNASVVDRISHLVGQDNVII
mmetsp:Transcript_1760/g.3317  ORF Transcript_1760/g.3317 Transcript_1760/m.3317 type:complete len:741 (-) Transcript_1760:191-2413(-)